MRKTAWHLRAAAMLPLATWNYLKKNRAWAVTVAVLFLVVVIGNSYELRKIRLVTETGDEHIFIC